MISFRVSVQSTQSFIRGSAQLTPLTDGIPVPFMPEESMFFRVLGDNSHPESITMKAIATPICRMHSSAMLRMI